MDFSKLILPTACLLILQLIVQVQGASRRPSSPIPIPSGRSHHRLPGGPSRGPSPGPSPGRRGRGLPGGRSRGPSGSSPGDHLHNRLQEQIKQMMATGTKTLMVDEEMDTDFLRRYHREKTFEELAKSLTKAEQKMYVIYYVTRLEDLTTVELGSIMQELDNERNDVLNYMFKLMVDEEIDTEDRLDFWRRYLKAKELKL